ncbi:MAG: hypothetical protein IT304_11020, partial [Dehalococcoidia bacterium]|nr:hypothetical protein [Dehalococcoidia bacterium]
MNESHRRRPLSRLIAGDPLHVAASMVLDVLVVVLAYVAALLLRFDGEVPRVNADFTVKVVPFIALAYVTANTLFGVYRTVWAYGSLVDIVALFRPVAIVTALLFGTNIFVEDRDLPLSVILMAGALVFPGMCVTKMRTRLLLRMPWSASASRRLLIVGAGNTGQLLARE